MKDVGETGTSYERSSSQLGEEEARVLMEAEQFRLV